jgi:hypothetical protein
MPAPTTMVSQASDMLGAIPFDFILDKPIVRWWKQLRFRDEETWEKGGLYKEPFLEMYTVNNFPQELQSGHEDACTLDIFQGLPCLRKHNRSFGSATSQSRAHFRKIFSQFWEQDRKRLLTWFSVELEGYVHPVVS